MTEFSNENNPGDSLDGPKSMDYGYAKPPERKVISSGEEALQYLCAIVAKRLPDKSLPKITPELWDRTIKALFNPGDNRNMLMHRQFIISDFEEGRWEDAHAGFVFLVETVALGEIETELEQELIDTEGDILSDEEQIRISNQVDRLCQLDRKTVSILTKFSKL